MDFLKKHTFYYGLDREALKIKDKLYRLIEDEIVLLGYEHVADDKEFLLKEVSLSKRPGYIHLNDTDSLFFMCEVINDIKKARERVFEILCGFRKFLLSLSRFSIEYSSIKDNTFYLIGFTNKYFKLITINIENDYIKIYIHKCMFDYLCSFYFNSLLRNYRAGLIIFDNNKSSVNKIKKQLFDNDNYFISNALNIEEKKLDFIIEGLPFYIIISNSLAKREEIKFVSLIDGCEKNIKVVDYFRLINQLELKENDKIFKHNLKCYLNNKLKSMNLCVDCAEEKSKEFFIAKGFTQMIKNQKCDCCNLNNDTMIYDIFENID